MTKSIVVYLMVFLICFISFPSPICASNIMFNDTETSYYAYAHIQLLNQLGIVSGYPDNTFRPEQRVTRAEFSKMIVMSLGIGTKPDETDNFLDVTNHWASQYISSLFSNQLITGFPDGTFRPDAEVTKAEALTMLARAAHIPEGTGGHFKDMDNHWAYGFVEGCLAKGVVKNPDPYITDGAYFLPNKPATRGQICTFLSRMLINVGYVSPELKSAAKSFHDVLSPILAGWKLHVELAESTARIQLGNVILVMEADLNKALELEVNSNPLIQSIKHDFTNGMNTYIQGLLAFMRQDSENTSLCSEGETAIIQAEIRIIDFTMGEYWIPTIETPTPITPPSPSKEPSMSFKITDAKICTKLTSDGLPLDPGNSFPESQANTVYCWLKYENALIDQTAIYIILYQNGLWLSSSDPDKVDIENGSLTISWSFNSLASSYVGSYCVKIFINNQEVKAVYFSITP